LIITSILSPPVAPPMLKASTALSAQCHWGHHSPTLVFNWLGPLGYGGERRWERYRSEWGCGVAIFRQLLWLLCWELVICTNDLTFWFCHLERYIARNYFVCNRVVLNRYELSESADFLGRQQKWKSGDVTQALELQTQLRMLCI
jgi:hypothetical protein